MKLLHIGLDAAKSPETSLMKTFKRHVKEYADVSTANPLFNDEIVYLAKTFHPDFVWMQIQEPGKVSTVALHALKESGAYVVNWTGDVRKPLPNWYIETGKLIDLTLFTNMPDVMTARKRGVSADFCAIGYDPDIYFPDYNVPKTIDAAFFGTNYGNQFPLSNYRKQIAQLLKAVYGNRFKVYGNGWKKADGNYCHSQPEEAAVLRRCKIAINVSHFEYARYSSDRLNRILGCGVFCLTHYFPEMEKLGLIDGETCAAFKDTSELLSKLKYYLEHEQERKEIAAMGHKMAVESLTFDSMIENLLSFYHLKQHAHHGIE